MISGWIEKLRKALGDDAVRTAPGDLFAYAFDAALEKRLPGAVALPRTAEDVALAVRIAVDHGVPYAARGAGTNLCGGAVPATGGLVIHLARLNRVLSIDRDRRRAWVEPGVVNLHLHKLLAPLGLFYAPDPASQKACTLGGNVGTNAGGPHCLKYGVTTTHVTGLEMVLPDGTPGRFSIDDPGFDLPGLLVGSEGTLGVATKIELNLMPAPEAVETFLVAFPSMEAAAQTVTDTISTGIVPATLEVMDRLTVDAVEAFVGAGYPRGAEAVLLIELDGPRAVIAEEGERVRAICRKNGATEFRRAANERDREKFWEGRRGAYPAMARLAPNVLVEDGVVPRTRLPEAVRRVRAIADREKLRMGLIAHAGDGNLHPNLIFDERDPAETQRVKAAGHEMLRVCVELGGSISGEHGIGLDKREAMRWLFTPPTLDLFRRLKTALDPAGLCNPDKLIPAADPASVAVELPVEENEVLNATISSAVQAQQWLRRAAAEKRPVTLVGHKKRLAGEARGTLLDTTGLSAVVRHDQANFTLTVQAGALVSDVHRQLAASGQFLYVFGEGTLGGVVSRNAGRGPRLRDQILGMTVALPGGDLVALGAPVVKNVAGYDAAKLFIGAWGSLGMIIDLTFRLHPVPAPAGEVSDPTRPPFWNVPALGTVRNAFDPDHLMNPMLFERP
ncbi:MAG: FAD-binding protein [Elusimicrobia bacterium]|nr:FAD-binding protein [Elusimicrobiota bacterium]